MKNNRSIFQRIKYSKIIFPLNSLENIRMFIERFLIENNDY